MTPWCTTASPGRVHSQLPPASAARSTTTEPGFIDSTMSVSQSLGAGLPGISAVVMTMFTSFAWARNSAISASMNSFDISLA